MLLTFIVAICLGEGGVPFIFGSNKTNGFRKQCKIYKLFGTDIKTQISGHCAGIINNKLYVFGGSDEDNKYTSAKLLSIELDLFRNKKLTRIYQYAKTVLSENPKDKTAKNVIDLLKDGADLPPDIYPFLQLD